MKNIYLGSFLLSIAIFYDLGQEGDLKIVTEKTAFSETEEIYLQVYIDTFDLLKAQKKNWGGLKIFIEIEAGDLTKIDKSVKQVNHISIEEVNGQNKVNLEKIFGSLPVGGHKFRVLVESESLFQRNDNRYSNWISINIIEDEYCASRLPDPDPRVKIEMKNPPYKISVFEPYSLQNLSVKNLSKDTFVYEEPTHLFTQKVLRYEHDCKLKTSIVGGGCAVGGAPKSDRMIYPDSTFNFSGFIPNRQGVYHIVNSLRVYQTNEEIEIYSPAITIRGYHTKRPTDRWTEF